MDKGGRGEPHGAVKSMKEKEKYKGEKMRK